MVVPVSGSVLKGRFHHKRFSTGLHNKDVRRTVEALPDVNPVKENGRKTGKNGQFSKTDTRNLYQVKNSTK